MKIRYFEIAKKLAYNSDHPQHRIGAVIVKKNRIVGMGFNKLRTHPKSPDLTYRSSHAEFMAILNTKETDLSGCEIYVFRVKKNGSQGISKPCKNCMGLIKQMMIDKVHYSCDDDTYQSEDIK